MNVNQNAKPKQTHCKAILQDIGSRFQYVGNFLKVKLQGCQTLIFFIGWI